MTGLVAVGVGVAVAVGFGVAGFVLGFGEGDFVGGAVACADAVSVVDALTDGDALSVPELEAVGTLLALALADADAEALAAASYARTSEITTWSMTKRFSAQIPVPVPATTTMAAAENAATRSRLSHWWAITSQTIRSRSEPAPLRVTHGAIDQMDSHDCRVNPAEMQQFSTQQNGHVTAVGPHLSHHTPRHSEDAPWCRRPRQPLSSDRLPALLNDDARRSAEFIAPQR